MPSHWELELQQMDMEERGDTESIVMPLCKSGTSLFTSLKYSVVFRTRRKPPSITLPSHLYDL